MNFNAFNEELKFQLRQRIQFATIAILLVWLGGSIGILAALSKLLFGEPIEMTTLMVSLIALIVSIPVMRERKNLKAQLETFD